ncbi:Thymidylate kinase [Alteracholeplasma palmae J233]|uniref:Thymidylate kinase n=1 Tax=Alteracholeplasma palmae (strain ATCC 49389 / J233) TaxID=1318466 RepID=U4KLN6_ALTPJ|nr:dTMP kinase [Alteracholeplasma palmae]CCV64889.1 Thymidylate kinase [Alteracholeplasma palmae J233]
MFITFEGGEGTGKTTIIEKLTRQLQNENFQVVSTREPGGSSIAEQIRKVLLNPENKEITSRTEALLYAASRAQHLDEVVIPALNDNKIVLCDRYIDSSMAYQGYARELGEEFINKINVYALNYMPDLTIYIDLDTKIGQARINNNRKHKIDRLDLEDCSFHDKVRNGYLQIAKKDEKRIFIIDGNQTIDSIYSIIYNKVKTLI